MSGPWPTPGQEDLLLAAFGPEPEARQASLRLPRPSSAPDLAEFWPLVERRWPPAGTGRPPEGLAPYLTAWRQNRERLLSFETVAKAFERAAVPFMLIKGAALLLRHYRDPGLRNMHDLDVLVPEDRLEAAASALAAASFTPWRGVLAAELRRRVHVRHGWSFTGPDRTSLDLHWRPVACCLAPLVTRRFWEGCEHVPLGERSVPVPGPTEQLFQVCVHGLQRDWDSRPRWVADALTVLKTPIDWDRLGELAGVAAMRLRVADALGYLRGRFRAPVPGGFVEALAAAAEPWERRERRLPLGPNASSPFSLFLWQVYTFRRLRPWYEPWARLPATLAFLRYTAAALGGDRISGIPALLWRRARGRPV